VKAVFLIGNVLIQIRGPVLMGLRIRILLNSFSGLQGANKK
jgi:hypothetical protein